MSQSLDEVSDWVSTAAAAKRATTTPTHLLQIQVTLDDSLTPSTGKHSVGAGLEFPTQEFVPSCLSEFAGSRPDTRPLLVSDCNDREMLERKKNTWIESVFRETRVPAAEVIYLN